MNRYSLWFYIILFIISLLVVIVCSFNITKYNEAKKGIKKKPHKDYVATEKSLRNKIHWNIAIIVVSGIILIITSLYIGFTLSYRWFNYKEKIMNPSNRWYKAHKFFTVLPDESENILLGNDDPTKEFISKLIIGKNEPKNVCGENEFVEFRNNPTDKYCFDIDQFPKDIKKIIKDISKDVYKVSPDLGYKGAEEYAKYIFDRNLAKFKDGKIDTITLKIDGKDYTYNSNLKNDDLDAYKNIEKNIISEAKINFNNKIKNIGVDITPTREAFNEANRIFNETNQYFIDNFSTNTRKRKSPEFIQALTNLENARINLEKAKLDLQKETELNIKMEKPRLISNMENFIKDKTFKTKENTNTKLLELKSNIKNSIKNPQGIGSGLGRINPIPWLFANSGFIREDAKTFSEIKLGINK